MPALGVGGVWNWRQKLDDGERLPLLDFDAFQWKGREVELVPDSDAWLPEKMQNILSGFYALGRELQDRGARVTFVQLPHGTSGKAGLDDWMVTEKGVWQEARPHLQRLPLNHKHFNSLASWYQRWLKRSTTPSIPNVEEQGLKKTLADRILQEHAFAKGVGGTLFHFRNGTYHPDGSERVRLFVKQHCLAL